MLLTNKFVQEIDADFDSILERLREEAGNPQVDLLGVVVQVTGGGRAGVLGGGFVSLGDVTLAGQGGLSSSGAQPGAQDS